MQFKTILNFTLIATVFFLILTLTDLVLTVAGWIFGDWFVIRDIKLTDMTGDQIYASILVFYITSPTDASVVASTVGLAAAIICIIAWTRIKKTEMDLDFNLVCYFSTFDSLSLVINT